MRFLRLVVVAALGASTLGCTWWYTRAYGEAQDNAVSRLRTVFAEFEDLPESATKNVASMTNAMDRLAENPRIAIGPVKQNGDQLSAAVAARGTARVSLLGGTSTVTVVVCGVLVKEAPSGTASLRPGDCPLDSKVVGDAQRVLGLPITTWLPFDRFDMNLEKDARTHARAAAVADVENWNTFWRIEHRASRGAEEQFREKIEILGDSDPIIDHYVGPQAFTVDLANAGVGSVSHRATDTPVRHRVVVCLRHRIPVDGSPVTITGITCPASLDTGGAENMRYEDLLDPAK